MLLAIWLGLNAPEIVRAEETGIRVEPLSLELTVSADQPEAKGVINFKNLTDQNQFVDFSAIELNTTDSQGNLELLNLAGGKNTNASIFISLSSASAVLAPQTDFSLRVVAKNSQSLAPGGHYAGVIARFTSNDLGVNKTQVLPAVSTLLLVRKIGGERYHISLMEVEGSGKQLVFRLPEEFHLTFANEGNIHLVPYGTVELIDLFGRVVKRGIINDSSKIIFPQSQRRLTQSIVNLEPSWPAMFYRLRIQGTTSPGAVNFGQEFSFIYVSTPALLLIICSLLILVAIKRWKRKRL